MSGFDEFSLDKARGWQIGGGVAVGVEGEERGETPTEGFAQGTCHLFGEVAFEQEVGEGKAFFGKGQSFTGAFDGETMRSASPRRGGQTDGVISNFFGCGSAARAGMNEERSWKPSRSIKCSCGGFRGNVR